MSRVSVCVEILKERTRQDSKWGADRDHPSISLVLDVTHATEARKCAEYGIPSPALARHECDQAGTNVTWAHIAVEEMSEAVGASTEAGRREELVQLAAVCVAWIESIDRRNQG